MRKGRSDNSNLMLTGPVQTIQNYDMKKMSVILLAVLTVSLSLPLTAAVSPETTVTSLVTLDVCTADHGGLSVNSGGQALPAFCSGVDCPVLSGYLDIAKPSLPTSVIPISEDRPPRS